MGLLGGKFLNETFSVQKEVQKDGVMVRILGKSRPLNYLDNLVQEVV